MPDLYLNSLTSKRKKKHFMNISTMILKPEIYTKQKRISYMNADSNFLVKI